MKCDDLYEDYRTKVKANLKRIKTQIKELEKKVYQPNVKMTDSWWKDYNRLNQLNIDRLTLTSRLNNYGKNRSGIDEYPININNYKNK